MTEHIRHGIFDVEKADASKIANDVIAKAGCTLRQFMCCAERTLIKDESIIHEQSSPSSAFNKNKFSIFFRSRQIAKKKLYSSVVNTGLIMAGISVIIGFTGLFILSIANASSTHMRPNWITASILRIVGTIGFSLGISLLSLVPVDEYDIDKEFNDNPRLERVVSIVFGILITGTGILLITFSPYLPGFLLTVIGIITLCHTFHCPFGQASGRTCLAIPGGIHANSKILRILEVLRCLKELCIPKSMSAKLFVCSIMLYFAGGSFLLVAVFDPMYLSKSNWIIPGIIDAWMGAIESTLQQYLPFGLTIALNQYGAIMINFAFYIAYKRKNFDGWRTSAFYVAIRSFLICFGVQNFITATYDTVVHKVSMTDIVVQYLCSALFLSPPLASVLIGTKKSFTLVARYFEYDIDRLFDDASLMAELASSSRVFDEKKPVWWIHRKNTLKDFQDDDDCVRRANWMKGDIVGEPTDCEGKTILNVRISYNDDRDLSWRAKYVDNNLEIIPSERTLRDNSLTFVQWCDSNFKEIDSIRKSTDVKDEYVEVSVKLSNGTNTREFLKAWANDNLRSFDWKDFNTDLFLKSPRELANDDEKEKTYALSSATKITDFKSKIDYFISHSWEDKGTSKCSAMSSFVSDKRGGYCCRSSPTFW